MGNNIIIAGLIVQIVVFGLFVIAAAIFHSRLLKQPTASCHTTPWTKHMVSLYIVSILIFVTALPISYYAARYGVDIDLLTRGAGFGYIGSTITSLIYASFTFIFFAIEAAIMALALEMGFGIPLSAGYLISSLAVIPLVTHGITFISRFQLWTQPIWLVLHYLVF